VPSDSGYERAFCWPDGQKAIREDGCVTDDDLPDWHFKVHERSAGVYEGTGTHVSGASVRAVGPDANDLLDMLRHDTRDLLER
jgi:hypothetical protein